MTCHEKRALPLKTFNINKKRRVTQVTQFFSYLLALGAPYQCQWAGGLPPPYVHGGALFLLLLKR